MAVRSETISASQWRKGDSGRAKTPMGLLRSDLAILGRATGEWHDRNQGKAFGVDGQYMCAADPSPVYDYTELLRPGVRARYEAMRTGKPMPELPKEEETHSEDGQPPHTKKPIYPAMKDGIRLMVKIVAEGHSISEAARRASAPTGISATSLNSTYGRVKSKKLWQEYLD